MKNYNSFSRIKKNTRCRFCTGHFFFCVSEILMYSSWILIEPKLKHLQTVVIIAPEIILEQRVEQRNTIQRTISIEVNKNVEQLFGHIVERLMTVCSHSEHAVSGAKRIA